jgi:DHA1 family tetracycline resistance protein-like MFS transporter
MTEPAADPTVSSSPNDTSVTDKYRGSLRLILLILFVDLLGFSLVVPLLPRYADSAGFSATKIGILMAAYPFCQLFAGPVLGRLSDRFGRKPVLMASQMGTTTSFLILAMTQRFELMLLARALDGTSGGNILVAQAYIADVTPPKDRARSFGLIGMVFGLGFIIGPTLGGLLSDVKFGPNGMRVPFLAAALFSIVAWIFVLVKLPESRRPGSSADSSGARVIGRQGMKAVLKDQRLQWLVLGGALLVLGWSSLEGTFSLFLKRRLEYSPRQASMAFAFAGLVGVLGQGILIRPMVARFGEKKLVVWGLTGLVAGFLVMSQVRSTSALLPALVIVGLSHGMAQPSLSGLISRSCSSEIQGSVFGTMTSAQTAARMTNFLVANQLLGRFGPSAPFLSGSFVFLVALGVVRAGIRRLDSAENQQGPSSDA